MKPTLSSAQQHALDRCLTFLSKPNPSRVFVLSGYAGTGKTTILSYLNSPSYSFCAPTGKAAQVLLSKGIQATTIHSLIYEPLDTFPVSFRRRDELKTSAIVIDEASMVSTDLLNDLLKFRIPLLFCGDPFQLPPVGIDPSLFTRYPGTALTEVHRQALDNPIISLATYLRLTPSAHPRHWSNPNPGGAVSIQPRKGVKIDPKIIDQCIVGYNNTRHSANRAIRKRMGFTSALPQINDRLICLRNNYELGVTNGQQFLSLDNAMLTDNELDIKDPITGTVYQIEFARSIFTDPSTSEHVRTLPRAITPLDFAYAITCHKSQGSEFNHVAIIDEPIGDNANRWRYTAVTRAKKQLTYFI